MLSVFFKIKWSYEIQILDWLCYCSKVDVQWIWYTPTPAHKPSFCPIVFALSHTKTWLLGFVWPLLFSLMICHLWPVLLYQYHKSHFKNISYIYTCLLYCIQYKNEVSVYAQRNVCICFGISGACKFHSFTHEQFHTNEEGTALLGLKRLWFLYS